MMMMMMMMVMAFQSSENFHRGHDLRELLDIQARFAPTTLELASRTFLLHSLAMPKHWFEVPGRRLASSHSPSGLKPFADEVEGCHIFYLPVFFLSFFSHVVLSKCAYAGRHVLQTLPPMVTTTTLQTSSVMR